MRTSIGRSRFLLGPVQAVASAMRAISIAATSSLLCGGQGSTPLRGDQLDGVAVAAHDAGLRRHVIGEDPVAAFARRAWPWHWRRRFRSRRQSRSPVSAACVLRCAMVERMSGFSTSDSSGVAWPGFFLIFCAPALATRQSATAAAKIATSTGSARSTACSISRALSTCTVFDAGRIGQIDRAADQRHLGAGGCRRRGDGVALLAGGAVGDVAHRIDRLVRRAGGDQHALALAAAARVARRAIFRPRRRSPAARPCGRARARPLPPSRPRWGR